MQTLVINDRATWIEQSGVHDSLLETLAAQLRPVDPDLAEGLLRCRTWSTLESDPAYAPELEAEASSQWIYSLALTGLVSLGEDLYSLSRSNRPVVDDFLLYARALSGLRPHADTLEDFRKGFHSFYNGGFCDLRSLSTHRFRNLVEAAVAGFEEDLKDHSYSGYLIAFSVFKALVRLDMRMADASQGFGTITDRKRIIWRAPSWAYDMVLEHLALENETMRTPLAKRCLASRLVSGSGQLDMRALTSVERKQIRSNLEVINVRYGQRGYWPDFDEEFRPWLTQLVQAFLRLPGRGTT